MLHSLQETCQSKTYSFVLDLYLSVWLGSLRSGLSGSPAPDTPGLIPHTSGSAPPTSLNRALKTTSDFTAHCPTPWEVGCAWACSNLGAAKSGQRLLSQNPARRWAQVSDVGSVWERALEICRGEALWSIQTVGEGWRREVCLCSEGEW